MMQIIPTNTAQSLDRAGSIVRFALPHVLNCRRGTRWFLRAMGATDLAWEILREHRPQFLQKLPTRRPLDMDLVVGGAMLGAAALAREKPAVRAGMAIIGLLEITGALAKPLSRTEPHSRNTDALEFERVLSL